MVELLPYISCRTLQLKVSHSPLVDAMQTQLFVLIICLGAVTCASEDKYGGGQPYEAGGSSGSGSSIDSQIIRILEANTRALDGLELKAQSISFSQKGIEGKLGNIAQELSVIGDLEDGLKKIDALSIKNFQLVASGLRNLNASIRAGEDRTDRAIYGVSRTQQEIKQVLIKVDAKQSKYESDLSAVTKSVQQSLSGLDNLLKQSVLRELVSLGQTAKKLEQSQRLIENKIGYLDELTALSGITANNVQLLSQGVQSLNATQEHRLAAIGQAVHEAGAATWQIDSKLGVLLSTQKHIEHALNECKQKQQHHQHAYGPAPKQPSYTPNSGYISDYE